jgi:hydrogenase maturation protease
MRGERRMAVIGVGNRMRRDDGAGLEVVDRVRSRLPATAFVASCAGDITRLMQAWDGQELAVVVDAARWPGATPGEIAWIEDAGSAAEAMPWSDALGSHGLGLPQAIRLARALGRLPGRLEVLAIAIGEDGHGAGLSPRVEDAVARAADLLVARLRPALRESRGGGR